MRRWVLVVLAVIVVVAIIASGLSITLNFQGASPQTVRDAAMGTLLNNFPDLKPFYTNSTWEGGLFGLDSFTYKNGAWTMQLNNTSPAAYNISVTFYLGNMSAVWSGTYRDGAVTQTSGDTYYVPHKNTLPEQAMVDVFSFMRRKYAEPNPYVEGVRFKNVEVPNADGSVGSLTYLFTGNGWNMTMQIPIVPDPLVRVEATLIPLDSADGKVLINWQGTWQNGTVTEIYYYYAGYSRATPPP